MSRYKICYSRDFQHYFGSEKVEIGKVIDTETNEEIFHILYNRDLYETEGQHLAMQLYFDADEIYPFVEVDDCHRECLYSDPEVFLCMSLHEYAHYIQGYLTNPEYTTEKMHEERGRCIEDGRVMDMELNADAFALYYVGKEVFLRQMDYSIKSCYDRNKGSLDLAIKELKMRRAAAVS